MIQIGLAAASLGFLLAACDKEPPPPATASLTHTYTMIDDHGARVGTVSFDPVAGGRVFDLTGKEIGRIVPP